MDNLHHNSQFIDIINMASIASHNSVSPPLSAGSIINIGNSGVNNANTIQTFDYYYSRYWLEHGDPRLHKSNLLGGGPWQMLVITLTYLTAIKLFLPFMMRHRKPLDNLLWPIRAYNAFMVAFNAYLYLNWSKKLNWGLDCWGCGKSMQRVDETGLVLWELTLLSRYLDFFDTIFFVLRKKYDHVTLLHTAHHTIVPIIVWFAGKFQPTPVIVFAGYINLPIHVIMYTYYGLSTFPNVRKYLWWKKYLTSIQIIQFCLDLVHSLQVVYLPFCKYHTLTYVQTAFSLSFLYLFLKFYFKSYKTNEKRIKETKFGNGIQENNNISAATNNTKKVN